MLQRHNNIKNTAVVIVVVVKEPKIERAERKKSLAVFRAPPSLLAAVKAQLAEGVMKMK